MKKGNKSVGFLPLWRRVVLTAAFAIASGASAANRAPQALTAEYRVDPVGIDAQAPRLTWALPPGTKDQAAYELETDGRSRGWVTSSRHLNVAWPGGRLGSGERHVWRVRTRDAAGSVSDWSRQAEFTTGVMSDGDWSARWIGPNRHTRPAFDFGSAAWITGAVRTNGTVSLRYAFDLPSLPADAVAELVHAAVPQHEIRVNGKVCHRWSGMVHDWRYPRFRNIAPWLKVGRNEIEVTLEEGPVTRPYDSLPRMRVPPPADVRAFLARLTLPDGRVIVSDTSWLDGEDRSARALGSASATPYGRQLVLRTESESPAFARRFTLKRPVRSAVLHVTGVGFYEAFLDGRKIGSKVLDPSPTDFSRRVLYSTYRLESQLEPGAHELAIVLGHGWYDMRSITTWNFETAPWRDFPRTIAQLDLVYDDGSRETVATDGSWRQVRSPLAFDCIAEGEVIRGGVVPGADFTPPLFAEEVPGPKGRLTAEAQPGAEVVARLKPRRIKSLGAGTYMIEMPVVMAGWIRMRLRGLAAGDIVSVRYDERADGDLEPAVASGEDGLHDLNLTPDETRARRLIDAYFKYPASYRTCATDAAFQTDRYIAAGTDGEVYEPRFTYNGFRYVLVRGLKSEPRLEDVDGCVVHTAFPKTGSFACSDADFMKLMEMTDRSYRSNFVDGVPTDCPHREKNGWTGDAWIASELAQYGYENTAAYEKWLRDLCDTQLPDGNICCIVPTSGWGYFWGNGPSWDFALPAIAWNLWRYRDDRAILGEIYPALTNYLAYTASRENADGLVSHGLGDWMTVDKKGMPSTELTSSCFYLQTLRIAAAIAALENRPEESVRQAARAREIVAALNRKFARGKGVYDNGSQTAQAFALAFGLVPEADVPSARARLVESVEETGRHLAYGVLGSKYVLRELSEAGRTDLAYAVLTNPTAPSPMAWVRKGATTLWEDWKDGYSRNHVMFGDFAAWAYQYLAGIRLDGGEDGANAFSKIVFDPRPIPALDSVSATVGTPFGEVGSAWKREGDMLRLTFTVPSGTRALARLPDGRTVALEVGTHDFVCPPDAPENETASPKSNLKDVRSQATDPVNE